MTQSKKIRALIADDESLARETIAILLEEESDFDIVGQCSDGITALETIHRENPDVVFLDVQMPGLTGIEVLGKIENDPMPVVVFVTAYDEYAVSAFEANAIDYLVKPYSDDRFQATINRVREMYQQKDRADLEARLRQLVASTDTGNSAEPVSDTKSRFMVRTRDSIQFIESSDIRWIEAAGDYVILHTDEKDHMIRETMAGMERKLDAEKFVRIHRSTIVKVGAVRELKPYFHGDYMLYLKDGTELKLSRRYWPAVEAALAN